MIRIIKNICIILLLLRMVRNETFDLTLEDKEYLLSQLPKNHKLSPRMQQIFNGSHFKYTDDRAKRQFMMYQPAPQPQPAYQLNIPIMPQTNPPSYVFVPPVVSAPEIILPRGQFKPDYQQWLPNVEVEVAHTTTNFNLDQMINRAAYETLYVNKKIVSTKYPQVFTLRNVQNTIGFLDNPATTPMVFTPPILNLRTVENIPVASTFIDAPQPQSQLPITTFTNLIESTPTSTQKQNVRTINNAAAYLSDEVSSLLNIDNSIILSAYNKSDCDSKHPEKSNSTTTIGTTPSIQVPATLAPAPTSALTLPTPPPNLVIQFRPNPPNTVIPTFTPPNTSPPNISLPNTSPLNTFTSSDKPATQIDTQVKDKLLSILEGVESIKSKSVATKEGLPCPIIGKWISNMVGSGFNIEKPAAAKFPVPLFPIDCAGFMKRGDWQVTARTPLIDGGLFVVTAIRSSDFTMATFTGECRTCNDEDTIMGHWLIVKPSSTCEEMNRGQDFFGDTWKRQPKPANMQNSNNSTEKTSSP